MGCGAGAARASDTVVAICLSPGCGKPTWNGQPNEYCSTSCKAGFECKRPGCSKPTWNGRPNEYCGRSCRTADLGGGGGGGSGGGGTSGGGGGGVTDDDDDDDDANLVAALPQLCSKAGCGKPSWNGKANEYCSKFCRTTDGGDRSDAPKPAFGTQVDQGKFDDLVKQFNDKWKSGGTPPAIKSIWFVEDPKLLQKHEAYCQSIGDVPVKGFGRNPGNQQRRFHATKLRCTFNGTPCSDSSCFVCCIIKQGFKSSKAGTSAGSRFGRGIYCSSTSSKAYNYGKEAMFVVGVACGVADISGGSGALPAGTHSRIVNNSDDECVVFEDEAMVPKYLLLF